ncbi:hypothetical protein [Azospirillum thermophilum]|uniref:Uncharacterized protein n=1 Tax=Azospirillum thermophilum TaxID=2202148 RepID=A0A2S2CWE6_9PROT|nr:hypothetical protein [Azospirillum thermophilum]AWK88617.1 hypothetical protein DEW08_21210 [Azospirillum thermophilum]
MEMTLENLEKMTPDQERLFLMRLDAQLEQDAGAAARAHLAAGEPIYYRKRDTPPGCVIKEHPDGRKELVDFSTGEERLIRLLAA